jgi:RNA polymerase sigma factor (sigma-70 family)
VWGEQVMTNPTTKFKENAAHAADWYNPDPARHVGLAFACADWAVRRWGGTRSEWTGRAWIALVNACRTYDPSYLVKGRPVRVSTHATTCIRLQLTQESMERLGHERSASGGERKWRRQLTLCAPRRAGKDDDEQGTVEHARITRGALVERSTPAALAEEADEARAVKERAGRLLAQLPERERQILELRASGRSLKSIAGELGLSRERVRQLQDGAVGVLRAGLGVDLGPVEGSGLFGRCGRPGKGARPVGAKRGYRAGLGTEC